MERVLVEYNLHRFDLAFPIAIRLCDAAMKHDWTGLQPRAFRFRGMMATLNNEYSEADAMFARAASLADEEQKVEQAAIQRHWGLMLRRMGRGQESSRRLQDAANVYRQMERPRDVGRRF